MLASRPLIANSSSPEHGLRGRRLGLEPLGEARSCPQSTHRAGIPTGLVGYSTGHVVCFADFFECSSGSAGCPTVRARPPTCNLSASLGLLRAPRLLLDGTCNRRSLADRKKRLRKCPKGAWFQASLLSATLIHGQGNSNGGEGSLALARLSPCG
jgi:hypothetical protein